MMMMMKSTLFSILLLSCNLIATVAFTSSPRSALDSTLKAPLALKFQDVEIPSLAKSTSMIVTAATIATSTFVPPALAEEFETVQYAELPPPYVPALFGLALLVGVGVLTGSLGNVMDEEASLGMQSGARAKKEIERSRSSFFKR